MPEREYDCDKALIPWGKQEKYADGDYKHKISPLQVRLR